MWNINGDFKIKMACPRFREEIQSFDINIFQETHLMVGSAGRLGVVEGYDMMSVERQYKSKFRRSFGGVMVLARASLGLKVLRALSSPDILTLESNDMVVVASYILPETNCKWDKFTDTSPFDKLLEVMTTLASDARPVVIIGDLNARTGVDSGVGGLIRLSEDSKTSTRGRLFLRVCRQERYHILNGLPRFSISSRRYTSHHSTGFAVVDYAVANNHALEQVADVQVRDGVGGGSDHLEVLVWMRLRAPVLRAPRDGHVHVPARSKRRKATLSTKTELDRLMVDAVESIGTEESRMLKVYGPIFCDSDPIQVYVDGSCLNNGTVRARAGSGVFFGPGNSRNLALRVPGEQSNNRGEAYAVLQALLACDVHKRLIIFSDSEWTIRTLTYWVAARVNLGWNVETHGDIFSDIVWLISRRPAPVVFRKVKAHSGNEHNDGADSLAKAGAALPSVLPYTKIDRDWAIEGWCACEGCSGDAVAIVGEKVSTSLPPGRTERDVALRDPVVHAEGALTARSAQGAAAQMRGRARVFGAATWRGLWSGLNEFRGPPKQQIFHFPAQALASTFKGRMNMALPPPPSFDTSRRRTNALLVEALGDKTVDLTLDKIFTVPFSCEEVQEAKRKIRHRESSAAGGDGITYGQILQMDNDALLALCNKCIDNMDAPTSWVRTVLVGLCKKGKPADRPESYRTIGLESCLAKFMTQLLTGRLVKFAEANNLLPPSQNGFREGYRTCNNMFILQGAIHRAKAMKKPLYVAYVDMTNAFPSTDHPTLWLKLQRMGAGGPMFDWLRWLYREMTYVVRHGGEESESFKANMGILIGDTCSPILWALYMADLPQFMDADEGKIDFGGTLVGCLEQADDILLLSTTAEGLQLRLNAVAAWCRVNFLEVNESKSVVMVIGRHASEESIFSICGVPIAEVDQQVYVGFTVKSTGQLLRNHYDVKMEQATAAGRQIWSLEQDLGDIMPATAIHLYETLVAPHLMYGCEIALDIHLSALEDMQKVQDEYMRRTMSLGKRSLLDILRSETGVKELRYWRLLVALVFLRYVIACPEDMWVRKVLWDALVLEFDGHGNWIADLQKVIKALPFPCSLPRLEEWLCVKRVEALEKEITKGMDDLLLKAIESSEKLYLIHGRVETDERTGKKKPVARMRRSYLDVTNVHHRKALTRVLLSGHKMAVEIWQYASPPVDREDRTCRYGCREVETPEHVWLQCLRCPELVAARAAFQNALAVLCTGEELAALVEQDDNVTEQMRRLVSFPKCVTEVASYAYTVEKILDKNPLPWRGA